jgi:DNA-binding GntR family transcriptional regulator
MLQRHAAPLREQAVIEVRRRLVTGELVPGERLKERELEEHLGVSRTVVREALRQLESEQLIEIVPQVGPRVVQLSVDDIRQLYELRAALECASAALAAQKRSSEDLVLLRRALEELSTPLLPLDDLLEAKNKFYDALVSAGQNNMIGKQLQQVQTRISQFRRITLTTPGRGLRMREELEKVVEAVADQDSHAAFEACLEHVNTASGIAISEFLRSRDEQE